VRDRRPVEAGRAVAQRGAVRHAEDEEPGAEVDAAVDLGLDPPAEVEAGLATEVDVESGFRLGEHCELRGRIAAERGGATLEIDVERDRALAEEHDPGPGDRGPRREQAVLAAIVVTGRPEHGGAPQRCPEKRQIEARADADLRKEYDKIKAQIGDKEYKVRHILVEKEDEAKEIVAALQKGEKFEKLAERSKDPGSKDKGGDLDWNAPGNFVKPFSDAMVATPKGKFTAQPVQTQFGWHVIMVEDVREAKIPGFDEVKPQLQQRMQAQVLDQYFKELRTKNGI